MSEKISDKHCPDDVVEIDGFKNEGATWPDKNECLFIDLMVEEVLKGNRPTTTFTKSSWKYMQNQLNGRTGYAYTRDQLKNKFHKCRQTYKDFNKLLTNLSGNGWDPLLGTITLEEEQWDELFKVNKGARKFKKSGCPHYTKFVKLFGDTTASGVNAHPSTKLPSNSEDENDVGSNTNVVGEASGLEKSVKRSRGRKKEEFGGFVSSLVDAYAENAKRRNDILENKPSNITITVVDGSQTSKAEDPVSEELMECFNVLNVMEDIGGEAYTKILKLLHGDVTWRKLFLLMSDLRRRDFIHGL